MCTHAKNILTQKYGDTHPHTNKLCSHPVINMCLHAKNMLTRKLCSHTHKKVVLTSSSQYVHTRKKYGHTKIMFIHTQTNCAHIQLSICAHTQKICLYGNNVHTRKQLWSHNLLSIFAHTQMICSHGNYVHTHMQTTVITPSYQYLQTRKKYAHTETMFTHAQTNITLTFLSIVFPGDYLPTNVRRNIHVLFGINDTEYSKRVLLIYYCYQWLTKLLGILPSLFCKPEVQF